MYDENETVIPLQELKESQFIIPILEIHGIKFSARSFQVDVFGKQIMLLDNKPIFNSCLIKKSTLEGPKALEESTHSDNKMESLEETHDNNNESDLKTDELSNNNKISEQIQTDNEEIIDELLDNNECDVEETVSETKQDDSETIEMVQDKNEIVENKSVLDSNYLEEVSDNITITDNLDTNIKLRKPNEVYYEIYKITKEKAKQHKKAAIAHYLEAKKIKNSYLLESMEASDDSSDDEITNDSEKIKKDINDLVEELY